MSVCLRVCQVRRGKRALGDVTRRREVLRRYFVKADVRKRYSEVSLKVQTEMLSTDGEPKGVSKCELSPAALFVTDRIYSVKINLTVRGKTSS